MVSISDIGPAKTSMNLGLRMQRQMSARFSRRKALRSPSGYWSRVCSSTLFECLWRLQLTKGAGVEAEMRRLPFPRRMAWASGVLWILLQSRLHGTFSQEWASCGRVL